MKKFTGILTIMLSCFYGVFGQDDYQTALSECSKLKYYESQECMLGKPIFDFVGKTYEGKTINLSDLKGKVILINFWSITCAPCMAELGGLNEIVDKYQDEEVAFLSFTWDTKADLEQYFFPEHTFKFAVISDCQDFIIEEVKLGWGFPTTFIVDQKGIIQKIFSGGLTEEVAANEEIKTKIIPKLEELLK